MIGRGLIDSVTQKFPQAQRVGHAPGDAALAVEPFEEADQHQRLRGLVHRGDGVASGGAKVGDRLDLGAPIGRDPVTDGILRILNGDQIVAGERAEINGPAEQRQQRGKSPGGADIAGGIVKGGDQAVLGVEDGREEAERGCGLRDGMHLTHQADSLINGEAGERAQAG